MKFHIGGPWWEIRNGFVCSGLFHLLPYHHRIHRAIWWVRHRFVPWNRFHRVSTGLPPGFYEADTRILHCSFEIFCRTIEVGRLFDVRGFDNSVTEEEAGPGMARIDLEGPKALKEVRALYHWWRHLRPVRDQHDPYDQFEADGGRDCMEWGKNGFQMVGTPEEIAADRAMVIRWADWEQACYEEDTRNLCRLMQIRSYLQT